MILCLVSLYRSSSLAHPNCVVCFWSCKHQLVLNMDSLESPVRVDAERGGGEVHELVRVPEVRAPRVRKRAVRWFVEVCHFGYHLRRKFMFRFKLSGIIQTKGNAVCTTTPSGGCNYIYFTVNFANFGVSYRYLDVSSTFHGVDFNTCLKT